jgi:hypothetical protein
MRLLGTITLIIGILLGTNYAAFIPSAEAGSAGPFTWVDTPGPMNIWGSFNVLPAGDEQAGDVIAAFVSDVVTGTPQGCIGALTLQQPHIAAHQYGLLSANADDTGAGSPEKDGARAGDTITFKYYSVKYNQVFPTPGQPNLPTTTFQAGSPTVQVDLPDIILPVVLSAFNAAFDSKTSQVTLNWRTESEISNLGFDVYRSESRDGKYVKVNAARIKGAGTDATPHNYQLIDEGVEVGKTYYYYIEDISFSGERNRSHIIKVTIDPSGRLKVVAFKPVFDLLQNFPNPFNPETWIPFSLAKEIDVTIRIYNLRGQLVRTLDLGKMSAGFYDTKDKAAYWDGKDNYGQGVSSGIYFYNLTAGGFSATKKLIVIK